MHKPKLLALRASGCSGRGRRASSTCCCRETMSRKTPDGSQNEVRIHKPIGPSTRIPEHREHSAARVLLLLRGAMLAFPSGRTAYRQDWQLGSRCDGPKCSGSATATRWRGMAVSPHCPQRGNIDPRHRASAGLAFLARKAPTSPAYSALALMSVGPGCITAHIGWRRASAELFFLVGFKEEFNFDWKQ
jgi:hypothetical protein